MIICYGITSLTCSVVTIPNTVIRYTAPFLGVSYPKIPHSCAGNRSIVFLSQVPRRNPVSLELFCLSVLVCALSAYVSSLGSSLDGFEGSVLENQYGGVAPAYFHNRFLCTTLALLLGVS